MDFTIPKEDVLIETLLFYENPDSVLEAAS